MIKKICKDIKKNLTKKNIIIFCVVFIFLFSALLSVMLYCTGNDLLAEYEKSDFVYPEESMNSYREELEREAEVKIQEVMENGKDDKTVISENAEEVTTGENHDSVARPEIEIPDDKVIKEVQEPKNDKNVAVDKDKIEDKAAVIDEKFAPEA